MRCVATRMHSDGERQTTTDTDQERVCRSVYLYLSVFPRRRRRRRRPRRPRRHRQRRPS